MLRTARFSIHKAHNFRVTDSGACQWYQKRNESEMLAGTFPAVKAAAYVPLCPFPSMAPVSGDQ